jgi:hypothetical protein
LARTRLFVKQIVMRWREHLVAVSAVGVTLGALLASPGAQARSTYESPYGYERTWNAALRLVRVDNAWKVTEKDDASGYILFEYRSPENLKPTPGSFELVRGRDADAPMSVLATLAQMPRYHEQVLLDALAAKMRREYGDPPQRRKAPSPPVGEPDAGADGSSGSSQSNRSNQSRGSLALGE